MFFLDVSQKYYENSKHLRHYLVFSNIRNFLQLKTIWRSSTTSVYFTNVFKLCIKRFGDILQTVFTGLRNSMANTL